MAQIALNETNAFATHKVLQEVLKDCYYGRKGGLSALIYWILEGGCMADRDTQSCYLSEGSIKLSPDRLAQVD